jgi:hypothetical protein
VHLYYSLALPVIAVVFIARNSSKTRHTLGIVALAAMVHARLVV